MKCGKVIGKVWADRKVRQIQSCRLLVIQPLRRGSPDGNPVVVADPCAIAGSGDIVVFVTNTDAAQAFETGFAPVNASVVALVDFID
jgi:microcompartment protein CcmK/EutM